MDEGVGELKKTGIGTTDQGVSDSSGRALVPIVKNNTDAALSMTTSANP